MYKRIIDHKQYKRVSDSCNVDKLNLLSYNPKVKLEVQRFLKFILIQDRSSEMYKIGMEIVENVFKKLENFKDLDFEEYFAGDESEIIEEENILIEMNEEVIMAHINKGSQLIDFKKLIQILR